MQFSPFIIIIEAISKHEMLRRWSVTAAWKCIKVILIETKIYREYKSLSVVNARLWWSILWSASIFNRNGTPSKLLLLRPPFLYSRNTLERDNFQNFWFPLLFTYLAPLLEVEIQHKFHFQPRNVLLLLKIIFTIAILNFIHLLFSILHAFTNNLILNSHWLCSKLKNFKASDGKCCEKI